MKTALVTAIGSFASHIVIQTLKQQGFYVIGCDVYDRRWVAQSKETDEFYQAPYARDEEAYIGFLKEICRDRKVNFLLPLTDAEVDVLNEHREGFRELSVVLCFSSRKAIGLCRDKLRLEEKVREAGICRTIPSLSLRKILEEAKEAKEKSETEEIMARIPWKQVVLKPFNGRSSSGLYRVYDRAKLPCYLGLPDNPEDYVVQPMIDGTIITVDVVRDTEGNTAAVPRRELLRTLNGAGTSVEVFRDQKLEEICRKLAALLDITGCVNFEFIEEGETGEWYFMECNPRFSGGAAFTSEAGYPLVENHMRAFSGLLLEKENKAVHRYFARMYQEYVME